MNKQEIEAKLNSLEERIMHFSHSILNQLKEFKDNATTLQEDNQYTWEKCFNGGGWKLVQGQHLYRPDGLLTPSVSNTIFAHSLEVVKSMRAMAMLSHIMAKANGDWVADWKDPKQLKACVIYGSGKLNVYNMSSDYYFLAFRDSDIAEAVLQQNRELILEFYQQGE